MSGWALEAPQENEDDRYSDKERSMVILVDVLIFIEERVRAAVVDADAKVQATHGAAGADKETQNRSLPRLLLAPAEPFPGSPSP